MAKKTKAEIRAQEEAELNNKKEYWKNNKEKIILQYIIKLTNNNNIHKLVVKEDEFIIFPKYVEEWDKDSNKYVYAEKIWMNNFEDCVKFENDSLWKYNFKDCETVESFVEQFWNLHIYNDNVNQYFTKKKQLEDLRISALNKLSEEEKKVLGLSTGSKR